jgi:hypothetical protein
MTPHSIRITASHFCAGVELDQAIAIRVPPILHYMRNWPRDRIMNYCNAKGWKAEELSEADCYQLLTETPPFNED